jgi:hypothetical protein
MTMLRDLLTPFQSDFSDARLGRERAHWFILKKAVKARQGPERPPVVTTVIG